MRQWWVYIMASRTQRIYTGITNDIYRRVSEHKQGLTQGFTSRYRMHRLVYYEVYFIRRYYTIFPSDRQVGSISYW